MGLLEFSCREARCFSAGKEGYFVSVGFSRQLPVATAAHKRPHTSPTGPVWGCAGVVSLPCPQNRTKGRTGPSFGFLTRTSLPLPLKGEGLGIVFLGLVGSALFVQNWVTLAQQGRLCSLLVQVPYPASKTAHRATQGRVWFHRPFLPDFFVGNLASWRSRW